MAGGYTDGEGDSITEGADTISAGDGNDSVQAGGGDDTLFGGMGDDTLRGGADDDIILGDEFGPYDGNGAPGDDLIAGEGGNDTVFGGGGNDTIYGDYEPGTEPTPTGGGRESFNWNEVGTPADGDPLGGPFVQDTGSVEVSFTTGGNYGVETTFEDDPQLLTGIDESAASYMIAVPFPHQPDAQQEMIRMRAQAMEHLSARGLIALFPSGVVATSATAFGPVIEQEWNVFTAKMIRRSGATIVPCFFQGTNSRAYQIANRVSPAIRQGLLAIQFMPVCIGVGWALWRGCRRSAANADPPPGS